MYTTSTLISPLSPTNNGGAVPKTTFGQVTTLAGSGAGGSNDGIGSAASFRSPKDVIVTNAGNVDVADDGNYEVREINSNGLATTFAGSTVPGANDGKGKAASFLGPVSLGLDGDGNIYVADLKNNTIRKIATDGTVSTFAGKAGVAGALNGVGTTALFNHPSGVAVDIAKDVFVADQGNNLVRRISSDGTVVTLAGSGATGSANGTGAQVSFNSPTAIAVDATGTVYVADSFNNLIRKITPAGVVTTFAGTLAAGSADGVGTAATFNQPLGIGCEQAGNFIYVGDTRNNIIRMMTPDGTVVTLAGSGAAGSANGDRFQASFNQPAGVSPDGAGDLYVADEGNDLIRKIICTGYIIDKPLPAGLTFDGTTGIISGTPTVVSPATDYKITAFNAGGSSSFTVNITVNQKVLTPQTITFGPIPVKTYGDADFDAGATSTNNTLPITYTSDNATVATIVNGLVHITGVGTANITAAQHGNGDYTDASPVTQLLTVKKAPLTIKADNQTRVVGLPNPPLNLTYTGFVYGETPAQLTTQPVVATTAVQASAIGDYPITVDFATSPNYEITQLPGVLTITAVPPTIVIPNTFTPNGDGINDIWNIQSLIDYPQCTVFIYTRYGKLIYESRGYAKPWDGTYNGAQVPVGTYYYIINPKTGVKQLSGYVTVLR